MSDRRRHIVAAAVCAAACLLPGSAGAQDRWPERFWIGAGGGVQSGGSGFGETFDVPLYTETERVTVDYPIRTGVLVSVRGGYRVWKRLTLGAGVTRFSQRSDARVEAQLPHPFFDNQFRAVEGTASAVRGETAAHVLIGWMQPLNDRLRVLVTAGPAFVSVEQTIVTGVEFAEAYPYDTATFSDATTRRSTRGAAGFNAGADVTWMFGPRVGAGALVQFTRARVRLNADGHRITVDAGGVQAAAGIRFFF